MSGLDLEDGHDELLGLVVENEGPGSGFGAELDGLLDAVAAVDVADGERGDLAEAGPGVIEKGKSEALPPRSREIGDLALIAGDVDDLEHLGGGFTPNGLEVFAGLVHGNLL